MRQQLPVPDLPLCVLPWMHLFVGTTGFVQLCCVSGSGDANAPVLGSVREQSLLSLFESERIAAVRQQMLAGIWPAECRYCAQKEARGIESSRQAHNAKYATDFGHLVAAPESVVPKLRSVDLRLNNVCNFKCRSCSAYASSRWFSEHNLIYPQIAVANALIGLDDADSFWAEFRTSVLPALEHLHIAGGEPLVTEAHYELLEALIAAGKTDVELYYDTNLSRLDFKTWNAVELWKRFPNLTICMSLDGVGARGEYIRHGLDYEQWLQNLATIDREVPHARRKLHFVVSVFNVLDLREHLRTILDERFVTPDRLRLTFLTWPPYLNAQVLPGPLKETCAQRLRALIDDLQAFGEPIVSQLRGLLLFLFEKDLYASHGEELAANVRRLDALRGEGATRLFPELAPILRSAG